MIFCRRLCKIVCSFFWCSFILLAVPLCNLGKGKWQKTASSARWARLWARGMARILNIKISVCGDPAAAAGKLVISNHWGYLDIFAEGALFPLRFAPKAEMRRWPFFGALVSVSQPVWVDRTSKLKAAETACEIQETLARGLAMLVYPEGTSTGGKDILPFKSTAFEAALNSSSALLPVLITHKALPEGAFDPAWYGDIGFLPHVWGVLGLKEIHTCVYIMAVEKHLPGEGRKELASRIHSVMSQKYSELLSRSEKR